MATAQSFETREDLLAEINRQLSQYGVPTVTSEQLIFAPYCYDERIGWDTYLVTIAGFGVWGFANGDLLQSDETDASPSPPRMS